MEKQKLTQEPFYSSKMVDVGLHFQAKVPCKRKRKAKRMTPSYSKAYVGNGHITLQAYTHTQREREMGSAP